MSMLTTAANTLTELLAAPTPTPEPTGEVDTSGILGWLTRAIVPIFLGILGVIFIAKSNKGRISEIMTSTTIVIIGLVFIGGAVVLPFVGDNLVNLLFK